MNEKGTEFTHRPVRTGTLTLLITVVLICLAVLAVLALATAQADLAMADRALSGLQSQAQMESAGQKALAAMDAYLKGKQEAPAETVFQEDGTLETVVTLEDSTLQIVAEPKVPQPDSPAAYRILAWRLSADWEPDQTLDLWKGM